MERQLNNRIRLLAILDYLYKYSDIDFTVTSADICDYLEEKYGVKVERHSIYRDIASLMDFGIDIAKTVSRKEGYFLASRSFEVPEIKLLLDAVLSAPFITERKTNELIEKLLSMLSENQAKELKKQNFMEKRVKYKNEHIYYSIDCLNNAIAEKKKIRFKYYHYTLDDNAVKIDGGRNFTVSPYALMWNNDKYYLIGNYDKYNNVSHYRIDRMDAVEMLDENIRPHSEVSEYKKGDFDVADYARKTFKMYGGTPQRITLICKNELFEIMLDKFGFDADFKTIDGDSFCIEANANVSDGLLDWLFPYCDRCRITHPQELVDMLKNKTEAVVRASNAEFDTPLSDCCE